MRKSGSSHDGARVRKATVEASLALDVRWWQRNQCILPGPQFGAPWAKRQQQLTVTVEPVWELMFRIHCNVHNLSGAADPRPFLVRLEPSFCHFGGERYWFICPEMACGRRAALLFLVEGRLACRRCCNLAYASQRQRSPKRALRAAQSIRMRLGGSASLLEPFPLKPPYMHWKSYGRLWKKAIELESEYLRAMQKRYAPPRINSEANTHVG